MPSPGPFVPVDDTNHTSEGEVPQALKKLVVTDPVERSVVQLEPS
jgi:hypothetical protein